MIDRRQQQIESDHAAADDGRVNRLGHCVVPSEKSAGCTRRICYC
jgi:hypothetical protein